MDNGNPQSDNGSPNQVPKSSKSSDRSTFNATRPNSYDDPKVPDENHNGVGTRNDLTDTHDQNPPKTEDSNLATKPEPAESGRF